ncbi:ATP-binding cassette long-chain fatty acid transporter pxa1 [Rhodotorula kratochvilovae]
MIRFLQSKLAISFRTRLTRYVHDLYLDKNNTFYKVVNLDARIGASGADQFVTTDVNRFCETLSALYSNVSKPSLDLILFNIQLGRSIGGRGSVGLFLSYLATAWILRKVTPAFGKLAAIEAKLEGDFRAAHSRLIINAEEVAFYDGAPIEKDILTRAYLRLIKHVNSIYKIRILYGMTEDMVVKYLWSAAGYCLISIPVFFPKARKLAQAAAGTGGAAKGGEPGDGLSISQRTENYISNRRLLLSLADAGGRLMLSWKDLSELAGSTSRVYTLLSTLHDLSSNTYASLPRPADLAPDKPFYDLGSLNGRLVDDAKEDEGVSFDKVPIVAPAPGVAHGGEELIKELTVRVKPGEHLLITGGNGSGKTAIARVLAGLWPVFDGVVSRPDDSRVMFLPQRPYLSSGSLRDQIIYPHSYPEFAKSGRTEADLMDILRKVHLAYLPDREGGYDVRKEWKDILSGGEKQRMGMARLFYHLPKYGVLDECTSAVSTDVEGSMYQHAKDLGITLITISHRPSLFKHHMYLLRLTGEEGKWEFTQIGEAEQSLSFQKEIDSLQAKLAEVEAWKTRLGEIDRQLHFKE